MGDSAKFHSVGLRRSQIRETKNGNNIPATRTFRQSRPAKEKKTDLCSSHPGLTYLTKVSAGPFANHVNRLGYAAPSWRRAAPLSRFFGQILGLH